MTELDRVILWLFFWAMAFGVWWWRYRYHAAQSNRLDGAD